MFDSNRVILYINVHAEGNVSRLNSYKLKSDFAWGNTVYDENLFNYNTSNKTNFKKMKYSPTSKTL